MAPFPRRPARRGPRATTLVAAVLALCLPLASAAAPPGFEAGAHFRALDPPVATRTGERIEVLDFFAYSCRHCYVFEPILAQWARSLANDVVLTRVPLITGPGGDMHARLFYTARALGVINRLHPLIFEAVLRQGRPLQTRADIRAFLVEQGVDGDDFDRVFDSPAIDKRINAAFLISQGYGVRTTPTMGVDGRYFVDPVPARTYQRFLQVIDFLIERRRAAAGS